MQFNRLHAVSGKTLMELRGWILIIASSSTAVCKCKITAVKQVLQHKSVSAKIYKLCYYYHVEKLIFLLIIRTAWILKALGCSSCCNKNIVNYAEIHWIVISSSNLNYWVCLRIISIFARKEDAKIILAANPGIILANDFVEEKQ